MTNETPQPLPDPAPDAVTLAKSRANQLVDNMFAEAIDQLRRRRDELDSLIRTLRARQDALTNEIGGNAELIATVINSSASVSESLNGLQEFFNPPTISQ